METKRKFITALSNMTMLKAPKVFARAPRGAKRTQRATIALLTAAAMLVTPLGGLGFGPFGLDAMAEEEEFDTTKKDVVLALAAGMTVVFDPDEGEAFTVGGNRELGYGPSYGWASPATTHHIEWGIPAVIGDDDKVKINLGTQLSGILGSVTVRGGAPITRSDAAENPNGVWDVNGGTLTLPKSGLGTKLNADGADRYTLTLTLTDAASKNATDSFIVELFEISHVNVYVNGSHSGAGGGTGARSSSVNNGFNDVYTHTGGSQYDFIYTNAHNELTETNGTRLAQYGSESFLPDDTIAFKPRNVSKVEYVRGDFGKEKNDLEEINVNINSGYYTLTVDSAGLFDVYITTAAGVDTFVAQTAPAYNRIGDEAHFVVRLKNFANNAIMENKPYPIKIPALEPGAGDTPPTVDFLGLSGNTIEFTKNDDGEFAGSFTLKVVGDTGATKNTPETQGLALEITLESNTKAEETFNATIHADPDVLGLVGVPDIFVTTSGTNNEMLLSGPYTVLVGNKTANLLAHNEGIGTATDGVYFANLDWGNTYETHLETEVVLYDYNSGAGDKKGEKGKITLGEETGAGEGVAYSGQFMLEIADGMGVADYAFKLGLYAATANFVTGTKPVLLGEAKEAQQFSIRNAPDDDNDLSEEAYATVAADFVPDATKDNGGTYTISLIDVISPAWENKAIDYERLEFAIALAGRTPTLGEWSDFAKKNEYAYGKGYAPGSTVVVQGRYKQNGVGSGTPITTTVVLPEAPEVADFGATKTANTRNVTLSWTVPEDEETGAGGEAAKFVYSADGKGNDAFRDVTYDGYEYRVEWDISNGAAKTGENYYDSGWKTADPLTIKRAVGEDDAYNFAVPAVDIPERLNGEEGDFIFSVRATNSEGIQKTVFDATIELLGELTGTITVKSHSASPVATENELTGQYANRIGAYLAVDTSNVRATGVQDSTVAGWATDGFTYNWFSDGEKISGANGATYQIDGEYAGTVISVEVRGPIGSVSNKPLSAEAVFSGFNTVPYTLKLSYAGSGAETLDAVQFTTAPAAGAQTNANETQAGEDIYRRAGEQVTIHHRLATFTDGGENNFSNLLMFDPSILGGVEAVKGAAAGATHTGTHSYTVSAADTTTTTSGIINIKATFSHSATRQQRLYFDAPKITATYGDGTVTVVAKDVGRANNTDTIIVYSSADETIAKTGTNLSAATQTYNTSGTIELLKAASSVRITATLYPAPATGARLGTAITSTYYDLEIKQKPIPVNLRAARYVAGRPYVGTDPGPEDTTATGYIELSFGGTRNDTTPFGIPAVERWDKVGDDVVDIDITSIGSSSQYFVVPGTHIALASEANGGAENAAVNYLKMNADGTGADRFVLTGKDAANYIVVLPDTFDGRRYDVSTEKYLIDASSTWGIKSISAQQGVLTSGTAGTARFDVVTEGLENGDYTVSGYTTTGDGYTGLPSGATAVGLGTGIVTIRNNVGTLTIQTTAQTPAFNLAEKKVYTSLTLLMQHGGHNDAKKPMTASSTDKLDYKDAFIFSVNRKGQAAPAGNVEISGRTTYDAANKRYNTIGISEYVPVAGEANTRVGAPQYAMTRGSGEVIDKDFKDNRTGVGSPEQTNVPLGETVNAFVRFKGDATEAGGGTTDPSPAKHVRYRLPVEPDSPENPAISINSTGGVVLSWTATPAGRAGAQNAGVLTGTVGGGITGFGITRYEINVKHADTTITDPLPTVDPVVMQSGTLATEKVITGLVDGREYIFEVVAVNTDGIKSVNNNSTRYTPMAQWRADTVVSITSDKATGSGATADVGNQIGAKLTARVSSPTNANPVNKTVEPNKYVWTWYVDGKAEPKVDGEVTNVFEIDGDHVGKSISVSVTHPQVEAPEVAPHGAVFDEGKTVPYTIELAAPSANPSLQSGDSVSFSATGALNVGYARAGSPIDIHYGLARANFDNNRLSFNSWSNLAAVNEAKPTTGEATAARGTMQYSVNPRAAIDGKITIRATFTHSNSTIQEIFFTDEVVKMTYGDMRIFSNLVNSNDAGTGAVRYSISNTNGDVVRLTESGANAGQMTIMNAGMVEIRADKEGSTSTGANPVTYTASHATYTLIVEPKEIEVMVDPDKSRYVADDKKAGAGYVELGYETTGQGSATMVVLDETAIEFRSNVDGTASTTKDVVTLRLDAAPAKGTVEVASEEAPVLIDFEKAVGLSGAQSDNYEPVYTPFTKDSTVIKEIWGVNVDGSMVYGAVNTVDLNLFTSGLRDSRKASEDGSVKAIEYKATIVELPVGVSVQDVTDPENPKWVAGGETTKIPVTITDDVATLKLQYNGVNNADVKDKVKVTIFDSNDEKFAGGVDDKVISSDEFTVEIEQKEIRMMADAIYLPEIRPGQGKAVINYDDESEAAMRVGSTTMANLNLSDILDRDKGIGLSLQYKAYTFTGDSRNDADHRLPKDAIVDVLRPSVNAVVTPMPEGYYYLSITNDKANLNYRLAPLNTVDSTVFITGIEIDPADTTVRAGSPQPFETKFSFSDGKTTHTPAVTKVDWSVFPETTLVTLSSKETNPTTLSTTVTEWETVELRASYKDTFMATVMVEVIPAGAKVEAQLLSNNVAVNRALVDGGRLPIRANMPIAKNEVGEGADEKIVGVRLYPAGTDLVNAPDGAKEISDFIAYMGDDNSAIIISSTDTKSTDKMANGKNFAKVSNVEVWVLAEDGDANKAEDWQKATIGSSNTITITPSIRYPSIKADGRFQLNRFFPNEAAVIKMTSTAGAVGFADVPVEPQGNTNRIAAQRTNPGETPAILSNNTVVLGSATSGNSQKARVTLTMDIYKPNMLRAYNSTFVGNKFDVTVNISSQKPSLSVTPGTVSLRPVATDRGRNVEIALGGKNAWTRDNLELITGVYLERRNGDAVSGVTFEDGGAYNSRDLLPGEYDDYSGKYDLWIPGGTPAGSYRLRVNFEGVPASSPAFVNLTVSERKGTAQLSVKPGTVTVNATDEYAWFDISTNPLNLVDLDYDEEPFKVVWQDGRTAKDLADHPYISRYFVSYIGSGLYVELDREALAAAGTTLKSFSVPIRISNQQKDKAGNVRTSNTASATLRVETGAIMASFKNSNRISVIDPDSKMSYTMSLSRTGPEVNISEWYYYDEEDWVQSSIRIGRREGNTVVPDDNFQAVITGKRSFDIQMMPTTPLGSAAGTVNGYGYGYVVQGQNYDLDWEIDLDNGTTINSWTNASGNNRRLRVTPNRPNASFKTNKADVTLFNNAPFRSDTVAIDLTAPKGGEYQIITLSGKGDKREANGTLTRTDGFGGNSGIEINRASTNAWTFRLLNRVALTRSNGSAPANSYTLKLEAWPLGTYKLDANGNADLDANNRPQPINKSTKPTNVNVKVNIAR